MIPILILLAGTLAILLLDRFMAPRKRGLLALLIAGGALLSLFPLARGTPSRFVLPSWQPRCELAWRIDDVALLFAAFMVLLGLSSILSSLGSGAGANFYAALFVLLAAGLGLLFPVNLITLCFGWVFLEFALFLAEVTGIGRRSPAGRVVQALGVFALLGAALLSGDSFSLNSSLPRPALSLVTLAALLRAGIYPLCFWELGGKEQALPYLISTGGGLYLLARIQPSDVFLLTLGLSAFSVGAMLAWIEDDPFPFVAVSQAGYAVLTALVRPVAPAINLLLCLGLLSKRRRGAPLALALSSLAGLPLTLGFVGRWFLYRSLLDHQGLTLLAPCLLAEVLLSAALFRIWFSSSPPKRQPITHLASSAFLAFPLLLLWLFPPLIKGEALPSLFHSLTGTPLWATLLLPPLGGYLLHRWGKGARRLLTGPMAVLKLEWLYSSLGWLLSRVEAVFQGMARAIEGEGYWGWVLLLVLLAFLFLWT